MTCIVGLVSDGDVYIGGDSAGVAGYSMAVRAERKVFRNGPFIMGFTSSFRMGNLLQYSFTPPRHHPGDSINRFMVVDFINAVRECLKTGGYAEKHNESERGGTFLVGYAGRLFSIYDDYQVGECVDGFSSVGCGFEIALGSLFSTKTHEAETRVMTALRAAEQYSAGVRGPFHVEKLEKTSGS